MIGDEARSARDRAAMRVTIVTDAWEPQVNGVVRTLERLAEEASAPAK